MQLEYSKNYMFISICCNTLEHEAIGGNISLHVHILKIPLANKCFYTLGILLRMTLYLTQNKLMSSSYNHL